MIKVITSDSFDFGTPVARLMDVHSRGVDRSWMQKRAALFTPKMAELRPEPGHSLIHLISLGAMEMFGNNRNGDGFNEKQARFTIPFPKPGQPGYYDMVDGLIGRHDSTFMKHGHVYKHHKNDDPAKSIGQIKAAAYNKDMHRGELVIKVPHDKEWEGDLQKLASGKDIPFSMAAKVPYDICSICGNKAKHRGEYCEHLRDHMTSIIKSGHQVFAINDQPTFFDISKVVRPADRIAWSLQKVASVLERPIGGAELAEELGVSAPVELLGVSSKYAAVKLSAAKKLAEIEKKIEAVAAGADNKHLANKLALGCCTKNIPSKAMEELKSHKTAHALSALGSAKIPLSVMDFLTLTGQGSYKEASEVEALLPGMYSNISNFDLETCIDSCAYSPTNVYPLSAVKVAEELQNDYSIAENKVQRRVLAATVRGDEPAFKNLGSVKTASCSVKAAELAKEYVKYQLSFASLTGNDPITNTLLVMRNYIKV
jgi:hypothetical protein